MSRIKLYYHSGSKNHGCEAIVRGTSKILEEDLSLFSIRPNEDIEYGLNNICEIIEDKEEILNKYSLKNILAILDIKINKSIDTVIKNRRKKILDNIKKDDICFSIGGDNYCYPGTDIIGALNNNIRKKGAKTVLWGCSVEPDVIKGDVSKDLSKYNLIVSRESISYNALKKANPNTKLYPDPAFQLDKIELPLPKGFEKGNTVGINVSPLIIDCERNKGITKDNYEELIKYIINNTNMQIALIPHVVWDDNDDRVPLLELYNMFKETGRVVMIEDCNCMELKGYISRCRFFIGARTHATIAAYSMCVPTLAVGYSVKARGIAKDIFGTYENYVLSVQSLDKKNNLADSFKWLEANEKNIRVHLENFIPKYKKDALMIKSCVRELVK
ncbi:polysaccharide pyruvyl transferase family protein [Terrisporobacter glycolicus]|uniref:Polysaccharide pyruvyl transferase domain-containing protein n=1 Tax=Terrisporobacter glycolicus ATCC 14880 = DSM 1288 TaxID=1121315 RepID=A0ABZ2ES84_9FIRM|nr:polysaccharide pyruvyl transferase family protein [Terrisporobacter glycolicus]